MATAKKLLSNLQIVTTEECFHVENCNNEATRYHTSSAFFCLFCFLSCVICPNFAVINFSSVQPSNIAGPLQSKSDQCAGSERWKWKEANHSLKNLLTRTSRVAAGFYFSELHQKWFWICQIIMSYISNHVDISGDQTR